MSLADKIKHDGRVDFEDNDKSYTIMSVLPLKEVEKAVKGLDWDKDDYDYVKSMLETAYGPEVDRTLWEHTFKLTCLALKKKRNKIFGKLTSNAEKVSE